MTDITDQLRDESKGFPSSAKILNYLDRCNQGVLVCFKQDQVSPANVEKPVAASSTAPPIRDRKRTGFTPGTPEGYCQHETQNLCGHEKNLNECSDKELQSMFRLTRDTRSSSMWPRKEAQSFLDFVTEYYQFRNFQAVQTADLLIGPADSLENPAPIGVELAAQWSTQRQLTRCTLVVISRWHLYQKESSGKLLRLICALAKAQLGLTNFHIVSQNEKGWWIIR